jgi:TolB-like protein
MADIFVSYARADKARVAPLVAALETQGWSVWWDPEIVPGEEFDSLIRNEIKASSAVIVVWTPASVASRWVRGEARLGVERGILVPVRFERAELPIDAMAIHTTDLDDWKEDPKSRAFQELLGALSRHLKDVPRAGAGRQRSICVLPFVSMSTDPEQEYFSDGLSEELLNQLAQLKGLKVAARTSSFAFKGQNPDLKVVSAKLGVAHVLEGSVRKAGNRLRITAQLIDAQTGYHLWSNTFNRELDDIFRIQEDIARAVADALKVTLGMGETTLAPGGTKNVEAYELYLRATGLAQHHTIQSYHRAVALFREALALDPRFVQGWSGLGGAYMALATYDPAVAEDSLKRADEAFERIKAIAPESWTVHSLEGAQLGAIRGDWIGAEKAFQRAIDLVGEETVAAQNFGYSIWLLTVGRIDQAIKGFQCFYRRDPLASNRALQIALDCAGRYDEAEAEYKRDLAKPADPTLAEHYAFLRCLAQRDVGGAKSHLSHILALGPSLMPVPRELLPSFDDKEAALAIIRKHFGDPVYQKGLAVGVLANLAAYFGDDHLALESLRRAAIGRRTGIIEAWHPLFARVRKAEGFKQFARDVGLYDYWRKTGHWGDYARPLGDDDFEIIR